MRMLILIILTTTSFAQEFRWGADLSFVPKLEHNGAVFRQAGYERSALEIFRSAGFEVLRLRLWHTPDEPWHGIDSVLAFAERADELGFKLLLDIHYSDTWADPAHQTKPAAWQSLSYPQLLDSVYHYTNQVICRFRDASVIPEAVQIGNEIGNGFLWDTGRVDGTSQQWTRFTTLLNVAVLATRDSLPQSQWPQIIIHHQEGGDSAVCQWFFDNLISRDVPFDIIGLSYYPWWHGSLNDLTANMNNLAARYDREVRVVETAYPFTTGWCDNTGNIVGDQTPLLPEFPATEYGQASYLTSLQLRVLAVPNHMATMICFWEPAWITTPTFGSPWENLALFDCDGDALPAFLIFPGLIPTGLTLTRINDDLRLRWQDDANPFYRIYAADSSDGVFTTLIGSTSAHEWLLQNEFSQRQTRFFVVKGSAE